jgi:glycerate kinase
VQAAAAIASGWRDIAPYDDVVEVPLSDGGPGFVDVLHARLGGELVAVQVRDPLGRPVTAQFLLCGDTAYVESAQACGLHLMSTEERDPRRASTQGVGEMVAAALERGAARIVLGLGGSGTNDGGRGMWDVLGGECMAGLIGATDVDNPLLGPNGASAVFGPQKGADRAAVLDLDDALRAWADEIELRIGRPGLRDLPGAGAAGGLGFAVLALGGRLESGFALIAEAVQLDRVLAEADVVVTGEGSFDAQSLRGKVPVGVARVAQSHGVPCVVVAGQAEVGLRDAAAAGIDEIHSVAVTLGSPAAALAAGAAGVRRVAGNVARMWSRSDG